MVFVSLSTTPQSAEHGSMVLCSQLHSYRVVMRVHMLTLKSDNVAKGGVNGVYHTGTGNLRALLWMMMPEVEQ